MKRACRLVVTRVLVAPQVLGSTLVGTNILRFNGVVLPMLGDIPVDSDAPMVILPISRICRPEVGFAGGRL